jgi:hypothetical protein
MLQGLSTNDFATIASTRNRISDKLSHDLLKKIDLRPSGYAGKSIGNLLPHYTSTTSAMPFLETAFPDSSFLLSERDGSRLMKQQFDKDWQ